MDTIQTYTCDHPCGEIEDNFRLCHFEAICELLEREKGHTGKLDPLPDYPQIQLLSHIDDCCLTLEINHSALSYRFVEKNLQIFLYNRNNWNDKIVVGEYSLTRALENNIWAPVSTRIIPAVDELNQITNPESEPLPKTLPMSSEILVRHWYEELINHAVQEYLNEIDQWYQTLDKYERRHTPDSLAS